MKLLISALGLSILLLVGCQDNSTQQTAKISKPLQTKLQNPSLLQHPAIAQPKTPSNGLGIVVKEGQIIIDTKQTKAFLQNLESKMQSSFDRIESSLRKGQIQSPNETGIIITDTTLQIDLNKTKNFMEKWVKSMESVAEEIDDTLREIEQSLP
jgi:hypothetical protein